MGKIIKKKSLEMKLNVFEKLLLTISITMALAQGVLGGLWNECGVDVNGWSYDEVKKEEKRCKAEREFYDCIEAKLPFTDYSWENLYENLNDIQDACFECMSGIVLAGPFGEFCSWLV